MLFGIFAHLSGFFRSLFSPKNWTQKADNQLPVAPLHQRNQQVEGAIAPPAMVPEAAAECENIARVEFVGHLYLGDIRKTGRQLAIFVKECAHLGCRGEEPKREFEDAFRNKNRGQ
jgi:hypothetical protein